MKAAFLVTQAVIVLAAAVPARAQDPTTSLTFDGHCGRVSGAAGSRYRTTMYCVLETRANPAASLCWGWDLSLRSEGVRISWLSREGTLAAPVTFDPPGLFQEDGFFRWYFTYGPGNEGITMRLVPSVPGLGFLLEGRQRLAKIIVEGVFPEGFTCRPAYLFYDDVRPRGFGVRGNVLAINGESHYPREGECRTTLCGIPVLLSFDLRRSGTGSYSGKVGDVFRETIEVSLTTAKNEMGVGIRGWNLALGARGVRIIGITTEGTAGAGLQEQQPGLRDPSGFEQSELTKGPLNEGAVSTVLLSQDPGVTLPLKGTFVIARVLIEGTIGKDREEASLFFADSMIDPSGKPVENHVLLKDLEVHGDLSPLEIEVGPAGVNWVTFDCSGDGQSDISDALCLLGYLLFKSTSPPCLEALDFNVDGTLDISHVIGALNLMFLGESPGSRGQGCQLYESCEAVACQ